MDFTEKELEQIKYALEYLHDAGLSDFGKKILLQWKTLWKNSA